MAEADLRRLAEFASGVEVRALPAAVLEKAKACLLYGLAVGVASVGADAPVRAARALDREAAAGRASRLLDGRRGPPGAAALANAVLLHSRVQEDAHPAGHMGVVVLPAALALAEHEAGTGADLLAAVVAGYEVALRVGRDHAAALSARGFRTTPAYGVLGAAAAAARLLRLDPGRTADALALAANFAGGLREFVRAGTGEYPFQAGIAARDGLAAAFLAAEGARAAPSALGGDAGFFRVFGDRSEDYGRRLAERLGEEFEVLRVGYKPFPVCQFHRGIVRGVLALRAEASGAALRALRIRMHPFEADFVGVRHAGPFHSFSQTFMSAPFCAALAWVRGAVTLAGLHRVADPEVLEAAARVEVAADPGRPRYRPLVGLVLADGRTLEWEETAGDDAYRLTWPEAARMTGVLGAEVGVPEELGLRLVRAVESLEAAPAAGPLVEAALAVAAAARSAAAPPAGGAASAARPAP